VELLINGHQFHVASTFIIVPKSKSDKFTLVSVCFFRAVAIFGYTEFKFYL